MLALALAAGACSRAHPPAPEEGQTAESRALATGARERTRASVRIGYQKIGSPFLLKERADSLERALAAHGASAEWLEFQAGPPILEAMRGDAVDIGYVGETPPVFAQAGGVPFVYIAAEPSAPKSEAILVPKRSPVQKLSQLKGKRVAVNRGSNVHYLLIKALASAGLAPGDVQITFLAPADARSAFDSGQVDAWVIWDPFQAAAELAGARTLRDGEGLVANQFFYVARRAFADEHPELVQRVLREFSALSDWAAGHAEEASRLLAASSGISYDALLRAERRHSYGIVPITPEIVAQQQAIADLFFALKVIPQAIHVADAVPAKALVGASP